MRRAPRTPLEGGDTSCSLGPSDRPRVTYFGIRMSAATGGRRFSSLLHKHRPLRTVRPGINAWSTHQRVATRSTNPRGNPIAGYHHLPPSRRGDFVRISNNCAEYPLRPESSQHERRECLQMISHARRRPIRVSRRAAQSPRPAAAQRTLVIQPLLDRPRPMKTTSSLSQVPPSQRRSRPDESTSGASETGQQREPPTRPRSQTLTQMITGIAPIM